MTFHTQVCTYIATNQTLRSFWATLCLVLGVLGSANAVIELKPGFEKITVPKGEFEIFNDPGGAMLFHQVIWDENFVACEGNDKDCFDYKRGSAYWVRFKMRNATSLPQNIVLEVPIPHIDNVILFRSLGPNKYEAVQTGRLYEFESREYQHKHYAFNLFLSPEEEEYFYVKLQSNKSFPLKIVVYNHVTFNDLSVKSYFVSGLLYGVLLIMMLYHLYLYVKVRDDIYLWYSLFTLASAIAFSKLDGIGVHWIPTYLKFHDFLAFFGQFFGLLFYFLMLKTFVYDYFLQKHTRLITIIFCVLLPVLSSATVWIPEMNTFYKIGYVIPFQYGMVICFISLIRGYKPALLFCIANAILAAVLSIEAYHVVDPSMDINLFPALEYILAVALVAELLLFSLALASRYEFLMSSGLYFENPETDDESNDSSDVENNFFDQQQ